MRAIWISLGALGLAAVAAALVAFPAGSARAAPAGTSIALVAYSTPKDAYSKIIPAFTSTAAGKDVSFSQSYGGSTEQAAAVVAGQPADVVALSLAPDVTTLVNH